MDMEQEELQFLGIGGIFGEAQKILFFWKKIFSSIAVSLVVPLSFIFLLHIQISDSIFTNIDRNEEALEHVPQGSRREDRILHRLASEWASYVTFKAIYLLVVLVFSLLSTSAVVYTVACVFTAKEITFWKILTVVPKVWRRLLVTFLWSFAILFAYNTATVFFIILVLLILGTGNGAAAILFLLIPVYLAGLVYISVVWHLASVISVLEDMYGLTAMQKSKDLIKGKEWIATGIFLLFHLSFVTIEIFFKELVVRGGSEGKAGRFGFGLLLLLLMSVIVLEALVVQTIVYFVCKSYHHESINKSSLADHLEVYLGDYAPLKSRDIQLEHFEL